MAQKETAVTIVVLTLSPSVEWWSFEGQTIGLLPCTALLARHPPGSEETRMKKTLASLLAATTIALTLTATATDVSAQWRRRGWGWGPGVAAGVIGGAVIAGAIIASRPPGYVVYPGYAQPVYGPGCYWASQPVYDVAGRVVGYTGRPVQVCPGYVAPPPPGAAGAPPPASLPSK
jgi:hypothetical protein